MKFMQRTHKKRRMDHMNELMKHELTRDEDTPNTPEQNLPSLEYAGGSPLPERGPIAENSQPAATASPLESLPQSVSAAESQQRGSGGGY